LLIAGAADAEAGSGLAAASTSQPDRDRALFVCLANGQLVALDRDTGQRLWTFDSGAPLMSSTNRATGPQAESAVSLSDAEFGEGPRRANSIFPGTDGSLYAYVSTAAGRPRIERLPVGVADLVNQSPVATLDGSMLVGSQHTSVFLLDGSTGQLLR
jgi:outer membrane protein assembly factor BamB